MKDFYFITASFVSELQKDFHGYLKMLQDAGYTGVELFGCLYGGYSAKELKEVLASYGLHVIAAHVMTDQIEEQLGYLPETGCKYVVCPGIHVSSKEEAYASAELLNELGKKAKAVGMKLGYHNHNNDFDEYDGERVIDIFINNTDPDLVTFELDAAWAWRAGVDAAAFVEKYAGRFELIHVKETSRVFGPDEQFGKLFEGVERDENGRPILTPELIAKLEEQKKANCKLGDGIINMPALKKVADAQGVQAYIVEREYAYTGDIFTTIKEDREYMSKL